MPAVLERIAEEPKELEALRAERSRLETRLAELAEAHPTLHMQAEQSSFKFGDRYAEHMREMRVTQSAIADVSRTISSRLDEHRRRAARELTKSKLYRQLLLRAIVARAERQTAEAELLETYSSAAKQAVLLPPNPAQVVAELDATVRWASESIRLGLVDRKDLPDWLRRRLEPAS
jgi:hypothetical protein